MPNSGKSQNDDDDDDDDGIADVFIKKNKEKI